MSLVNLSIFIVRLFFRYQMCVYGKTVWVWSSGSYTKYPICVQSTCIHRGRWKSLQWCCLHNHRRIRFVYRDYTPLYDPWFFYYLLLYCCFIVSLYCFYLHYEYRIQNDGPWWLPWMFLCSQTFTFLKGHTLLLCITK